MSTGLIYADAFLEHDTGHGHPERADRLKAVVEKLRVRHQWDRLEHLAFSPAPLKRIERVHEHDYVRRCFQACREGAPYIDTPDSRISRRSAEIAQYATGGVLAAVDAVMDQLVGNAFCAVRPPGHHAEADRSMGFCLFNHVAIAAQYLLDERDIGRVAIVDWDVHHGNGTQHLFENRAEVFYVSLHEHPQYQYPGTGYSWERGQGEGEGATLNIPLDPGSGDQAFYRAMREQVGPALERFEPGFVLVSAGFDAAAGDPLGHLEVSAAGFAWISRFVKAAAERLCGGRLVSVLEGGYNLQALAEAVAEHVDVLLDPAGHDGLMAMKAGV